MHLPLNPLALAGVAACLFVGWLVHQLFFSPLSKLPGPRWTALTRLWLIYHEFKGDRTLLINRLHAQYGPVVRLAPDEVAFNSLGAVRDIYGAKSDFPKSNFYDMFVYYGERNVFTSPTKNKHDARKKLVAENYTKSFVMQPAVADEVRRHVAAFMAAVGTQPIMDVYVTLHYFALDVITNHVYGRYGTHTLSEPTHRHLFRDLSGEKHRTRLYLLHYGLSGAVAAVRGAWRRLVRGETEDSTINVRGARVNAYGKESVANWRTYYGGGGENNNRNNKHEKNGADAEKAGETNPFPSVCATLLAKVPSNDNQVAAECIDHLVAGIDTTGDALCVLLWKLSQPEHRPIQERLCAELQALDRSENVFAQTMTAPMAALDALPYLDAVIREGLRWRPSIPMTLFRVVVPSQRGGGGGPPQTIDGCSLPPGTVVGCQPYSLHRVPDVFDDPEAFVPERWLTTDTAKLSAMRAHYWPFSSGARLCLGHHVATMEMKMLVASVYRYYRTETTPSCTDASMAMDDQLTSGVPYGMKCVLKFERRE